MSNCYVWKRVQRLTNNYHPQGGVVVIAETLEQAHSLILENDEVEKEAYTSNEPDLMLVLNDHHDPQVIIFPDTGCC